MPGMGLGFRQVVSRRYEEHVRVEAYVHEPETGFGRQTKDERHEGDDTQRDPPWLPPPVRMASCNQNAVVATQRQVNS